MPSAFARVTYDPNPAAVSLVPASEREKKADVLAFCTATSSPKTGASTERNMPKTLPSVSTTAIETRALLPIGCLMPARVLFAVSAAAPSICVTSATVSDEPAIVGNLELNWPLTPFNTPGIKSLAGVAMIELTTTPGRLPNERVGTIRVGTSEELTYGKRMPSTRILSARISGGASNPRVAETAMISSTG